MPATATCRSPTRSSARGPDLVYIPSWVLAGRAPLGASARWRGMLERIGVVLAADHVRPPRQRHVRPRRARAARGAGRRRARGDACRRGGARSDLGRDRGNGDGAHCSRRRIRSSSAALALFNPMPRVVRDDDYPWAADPVAREDADPARSRGAGAMAPTSASSRRAWPTTRSSASGARGSSGWHAAPVRCGRRCGGWARTTCARCCPRSACRRSSCGARDDHWLDERHAHYVLEHVPNARCRSCRDPTPS